MRSEVNANMIRFIKIHDILKSVCRESVGFDDLCAKRSGGSRESKWPSKAHYSRIVALDMHTRALLVGQIFSYEGLDLRNWSFVWVSVELGAPPLKILAQFDSGKLRLSMNDVHSVP